jgi:hypothetical protein
MRSPARERERERDGIGTPRERSVAEEGCLQHRRAFIILQLRYGIIFSVRVGINERIKMHIPASTFACLRIGSGVCAKERERTRERELAWWRGPPRGTIESEEDGRTRDERWTTSACTGLYVPTESCPTRWRHQSILCMPDESTRLGSDTELTRRPTRPTRFRVKLESELEAACRGNCARVTFSTVISGGWAVRRFHHQMQYVHECVIRFGTSDIRRVFEQARIPAR